MMNIDNNIDDIMLYIWTGASGTDILLPEKDVAMDTAFPLCPEQLNE